MNRRNTIIAVATLALAPWKKLFSQPYQPTGFQVTYENIELGVVGAFWNPSTFPTEAQQLQFRSVSNVSEANASLGYDIISTAESIKAGKAFLNVPSGVLLQIVAVPITSGPEYNYADIQAGTVQAIVPL